MRRNLTDTDACDFKKRNKTQGRCVKEGKKPILCFTHMRTCIGSHAFTCIPRMIDGQAGRGTLSTLAVKALNRIHNVNVYVQHGRWQSRMWFWFKCFHI